MTDGVEVKWTGPKRRRRLRFERRDVGGWLRIEQVFRGGRWETVGQELVNDVSLEVSGDVDQAMTVGGPELVER